MKSMADPLFFPFVLSFSGVVAVVWGGGGKGIIIWTHSVP